MSKLLRIWGVLCFCALCSTAGYAQLTAAFSANRTSGCAPQLIQFTDNSTGNPDKWEWDLGNGTTSVQQNPSVTYLTPGVYTVKLTVSRGGQTASTTRTGYIQIFAIPVVSISANPRDGCIPVRVNFTDNSTTASGSIAKWKWDFGDGNVSDQRNPVHSYVTSGSFNVTLTVETNNGCTNSRSNVNYIKINDSIRSRFDIKLPNTCGLPYAVQFTDRSTGANINRWLWDFGDGNTSTERSPNHTYTAAGVFTVKLVVGNTSGCSDTLERVNVINSTGITADFSISKNPACLNESVTLTATTNAPVIDSAIWLFSDGSRLRGLNINKRFTTPGSNTIRLTVYAGGCSREVVKNINITNGPTANFDADVRSACTPPLTVNFTNQSTNGTVVGWRFGGGGLISTPNPSYTFTDFGSYNVTLIVANPNGCRDTLFRPAYIVIAPPSIDTIEGLPLEGCAPITGTFRPAITSAEPITSFEWDFGDGTTSTDRNPTKTYSDTGVYAIRLIVRNDRGCIDTFETEAKSGLRPRSNFTAAPLTVCPSDRVSYTSSSTGVINKVEWYFGDGGTSNSLNPTYMYNDTGFMDVILIVSHNGCGDTLQREKYIYVSPPIARFTDSFVCTAKFQRFFKEDAIGATAWIWDFGDGTTFNGQFPPPKTYADTGDYRVTLTVRDSLCEHTTGKTISITDQRPQIIINERPLCTEGTYSFTASGGGVENSTGFIWTQIGFGGEQMTDTPYLSRRLVREGNYGIRLTTIDPNGCGSTVERPFRAQFLKPKAIIKPEFTAICAGNTIDFPDSSIISPRNPVVSYVWDFGQGGEQRFTSPPFSHTYNSLGYFDLKLTIIDSAGCFDSTFINQAVAVFRPDANFYSPDTVVCIGAPVAFVNESTGSRLSYKWNLDDGQSSTDEEPTAKYMQPGSYNISLEVTDSIGCKSLVDKPLYIKVADAKADFVLSDSFTTCPPLQVGFTNKSVAAQSYIWDFGNGNGSLLTDPIHTYNFAGTFNAKLKAFGNGGCVDSVSKKVKIQGPSGDIRYTPLSGCAPLEVEFVSTAINTAIYTWDFSDGTSRSDNDSSAAKSYLLPGKYVPRLILEDGLGCRLPVQGPDTIIVTGAKAFIAELDNFVFCDSATIAFRDSSIATDDIVSYDWNFGDGTSSSEAFPQHTFSTPGRYKVTMSIVTRSGCSDVDTLSSDVLIVASPIVRAGADTAICLPGTINFEGTWVNPDSSTLIYNWDFGNSITSNQLDPPPISYNQPGDFQAKLRATNSYGCADEDVVTVAVKDTPTVVASPNAIVCLGSSINLSVSGASTYRWDANPTLSCLDCPDPVINPIRPTIYRVTGTDANGCQSTDTLLIGVKTPFTMSNSPGDTICVGESARLFANGAEQYSWTPASTLSNPNGSTTIARPTATTTYRVIGRDLLNCFYDTADITVFVYPIPTIDVVETSITLPIGSTVTLNTNSSADVTTWRWSPALGLSCITCGVPDANVQQRITYTVTASNPGGCVAKDQVTIIPTCTPENIFVPNTFSPNGDGQNDIFYPRGRGIAGIKAIRIFNRWGEVMYERKDFAINDPTAGWDGTYQGKLLTPDVYVYIMEVLCNDNSIFNVKGNVTLLR